MTPSPQFSLLHKLLNKYSCMKIIYSISRMSEQAILKICLHILLFYSACSCERTAYKL